MDLAQQMNLTAAHVAHDVSEFKIAGLTAAPSKLVNVPRVHIDKAMIKDGVYQTGLARPIVRAGRRGDYFEIKPENMFEMIRPD